MSEEILFYSDGHTLQITMSLTLNRGIIGQIWKGIEGVSFPLSVYWGPLKGGSNIKPVFSIFLSIWQSHLKDDVYRRGSLKLMTLTVNNRNLQHFQIHFSLLTRSFFFINKAISQPYSHFIVSNSKRTSNHNTSMVANAKPLSLLLLGVFGARFELDFGSLSTIVFP